MADGEWRMADGEWRLMKLWRARLDGYSKGMTVVGEMASKPGNDGALPSKKMANDLMADGGSWREALCRFLRLM